MYRRPYGFFRQNFARPERGMRGDDARYNPAPFRRHRGGSAADPSCPLQPKEVAMTTTTAPASKSASKSGSTPRVKVRQTKMLIDGKWVDSASGKTFETINPAT